MIGRGELLLFGLTGSQSNDRLVFGKGNEQCACLNAALIGGSTDATPGGINFGAGGFDLGASELGSVGHGSSSVV
jgi:hypothetical protein